MTWLAGSRYAVEGILYSKDSYVLQVRSGIADTIMGFALVKFNLKLLIID